MKLYQYLKKKNFLLYLILFMQDSQIIHSNKIIRNYIGDGIYLSNFLINSINNKLEPTDFELSKNLIWNTFKCSLIMNSILFGYEFTKGRQYYGIYVKTFFKGIVFGLLYSIYYNNIILEEHVGKKRLKHKIKIL